MNEPAQRFASVARQYCSWAERDGSTPQEDARTARRLLAALYLAAIDLPDVFDETEAPRVSDEMEQRVMKRFGSLPFSLYAECYDPLVVPGEQPVVADLADDLADIYRDLKRGLELCDRGKLDAAVWEWRFHFGAHWGHHAVGALYALHAWFTENPDESVA